MLSSSCSRRATACSSCASAPVAHGAHRLSCLTLRADELQALEEALIETERLASVLRLVFG